MKTIRQAASMQAYSRRLKRQGKKIGFVPTMGYLHEGHLSLVRRSVRDNDVTIASIFVNPLQFGPKEDLEKYPRDFKRDEVLLKRAGVDAVFYPTAAQMFPGPYHTYVNVEYLSQTLCGSSRPGHFRGVATVVAKLFNIVRPDIAYFGQKDAQQAIIIKQMVRDLNMDIRLKVMPIVREKDGLAMSSRNAYLNPQERREAAVLYESLKLARSMLKNGCISPDEIVGEMKKLINRKKTARIDYVKIVDEANLRPASKIQGNLLVVLAVYIGKTRLIDNTSLRGLDIFMSRPKQSLLGLLRRPCPAKRGEASSQ